MGVFYGGEGGTEGGLTAKCLKIDIIGANVKMTFRFSEILEPSWIGWVKMEYWVFDLNYCWEKNCISLSLQRLLFHVKHLKFALMLGMCGVDVGVCLIWPIT